MRDGDTFVSFENGRIREVIFIFSTDLHDNGF